MPYGHSACYKHTSDYKARWAGVPVEYVSPAYTSKKCHTCGAINEKLKLTDRCWLCPRCGAKLDRDFNAAINIERRGKVRCLGEGRPGARGTDEAVKGNETMALTLGAEVPKPGLLRECSRISWHLQHEEYRAKQSPFHHFVVARPLNL